MGKTNEEIERQIVDLVDEYFPKNEKCSCGKRLPCRSKAIVFAAEIVILFEKFKKTFKKELLKKLKEL